MLQSPPEGLKVTGPDAKLNVVSDNTEQYPSFSRLLYGSLDMQLVMLYILLFIFFLRLSDHNDMLALFIVYFFEQCIRSLRDDWGKSNMCNKTYVDERFLN